MIVESAGNRGGTEFAFQYSSLGRDGRRCSRCRGASMTPSLCESCRWMREVTTPRSRFLLCELSKTNPDYRKYPPQPIVRCQGYEQKQADETTDEK